MKTNQRILSFILIVSTILMAGCGRSNKGTDSILTGEATIVADEALKPLIETQLDIFHNIYKASLIECRYMSEYDAINQLVKEDIRLAIVGRPLNEKEVEFFKAKDIVPASIPLASDAIALIVPASNDTLTLTMDQIKQILSGEISDWSQISGSGKSGSIQLVFDTEASGIIRFLNEKLDLKNKISGNMKFAGSNEKVIETIAGNINGIGFVGYNWLSETESIKVQETLKRVHFIGVSATTNGIAGERAFMPSVSSIYDMEYPLTRQLYAIYTDPTASLPKGFLALLTSERGQRAIYRMGLKPNNDFQREVRIREDF